MFLPSISPPNYIPLAVTFDGTNDYLKKTSGASCTDSSKFTFSFWARRNAPITQDWIFAIHSVGGPGDDKRLDIRFDGATAPLLINAKNSSGTELLEVLTSNIGDTDWHHYMGSFDVTDTGKRHLYVDGISDLATINIYTSGTIELSGGASPNYIVANQVDLGGSALMFNGDMAQFYFESDVYIDLSVAANRAKFISPTGRPVNMGPNGTVPTGSRPDFFLDGALAGWATNKGTGGGFTTVGTLTEAATRP